MRDSVKFYVRESKFSKVLYMIKPILAQVILNIALNINALFKFCLRLDLL